MMKVIFEDVQHETLHSVGFVIQINAVEERVNGRVTKQWKLLTADGSVYLYPQRWYHIYRVEI